jgi:benzoate transport
MTHTDIGATIRDRPMTATQLLVIGICVLTNVLDGFDVLSLSFTAPALAREWGLRPDELGFLLSAGLVGMALGAFAVSPLADLLGRRTSILQCLCFMAAGMLLAAVSRSILWLAAARILTGLGAGAMTSCAGTMVVEYASARQREAALGWVVAGYPAGSMIGGGLAIWLLGAFGWRAVFVAGGLASLAVIPLVIWTLPESLDYLLARRPRNALTRINAVLARLDVPPIDALPPPAMTGEAATRIIDIVRGELLRRTIPLCLTYFAFMLSFYFILNWATKLTTEAGFADSGGISVSILINIGGVLAGLSAGWIARRLGLLRTTVGALALMGIGMAAFGILPASLPALSAASFITGFAMFVATVTLYAIMASAYPAAVRATAIGVAISAGRFGSILGPSIAGVLLAQGIGRTGTCVLLATPALIAAVAITRVRVRHEERACRRVDEIERV